MTTSPGGMEVVRGDQRGTLVGANSFRYERFSTWGRSTSDGAGFGKISAVALDSSDRVYVYQRDIHERGIEPIVVLTPEGDACDAWGRGIVRDAHGLFMFNDVLFAVDRDGHQVVKFALTGDVLMTLGNSKRPSWQQPFNHPTDVAVAPDGEIYVADGYCNSCVHRFTADGELIATWGNAGIAPAEFIVPHGIWVDETCVFVADRDNHRVQIFTRDGEFVQEWTQFYRPTDIYVDREGFIYVTELIPRVSIMTQSGELVARIRPANNNAHGVWADSRGSLYVALTDGPTLEKFERLLDDRDPVT